MTGFNIHIFFQRFIFYYSQVFHTICVIERFKDVENLKNDPEIRLRADSHDTYNYKSLSKWGAIPNREEKPWRQIGTNHLKERLKLQKR